MSFLRAAVNARRLEAEEDEVDQLSFVKMVRAKAGALGISDDIQTCGQCRLFRWWRYST